ncbi:Uncharacterised protein [Mycobacteroides abscessus subsp. abscessus]|nr:Uncharacterised protein [Mycobacteroides abscessus subsp. abscessus]
MAWLIACIQPGMVCTGANAPDMNVSGNITIIEMPCTDAALLPVTPTSAQIQLMANEHSTITSDAASTPAAPPPGRYPRHRPTTTVSAVAMP